MCVWCFSKSYLLKKINSHIHGNKVYLKKADQLNHHLKTSLEKYKYDAAIIHVGINNILQSKGENEVNDTPRKIMNIADTCRNYIISKIFISSIIRCSRTTVDIDYINGKIRELCIQNSYEFIKICKLMNMTYGEMKYMSRNLVRY